MEPFAIFCLLTLHLLLEQVIRSNDGIDLLLGQPLSRFVEVEAIMCEFLHYLVVNTRYGCSRYHIATWGSRVSLINPSALFDFIHCVTSRGIDLQNIVNEVGCLYYSS